MNLSNLTYNNLMYFSVVFEERNLSKAAERISISRQALSKSISALEHNLEKVLFIRKQNGVEPTPDAIELFPHVKTILKEYNQISKQGKMEQMAKRRITIYTIDEISQVFPNSFYENFFDQYPDIILTIEERNENYAIQQLLTNNCDFAIVSNESNYYDFSYTFLFHADYGSFMSENHPLAAIENLRLSDFQNTKFIGKTMDLEYYNKAIQAVYNNNLELDFFLEITNSGKRRELVRGGKFVSCAWNTNIFYNLDDGVIFKPVREMGKGIDLYLIENKHIKNPNKNAAVYKQYLIDWIRSHTT